jgi:4-amino-4-deoxy-L-arabinose transferase-like glycosyltransferase
MCPNSPANNLRISNGSDLCFPVSSRGTDADMNRPSPNPLIFLGILTALLHALVLLVVIPAFSNRLTPFYNQDHFMDGYDQISASLVQGKGYRFYPDTGKTLMREPGYPVFVAGLFMLFGDNFTAVKLANLFFALLTAWMMTRLARKISLHPIMRVAPPLLFLFHPATLVAESRGGVEILFCCLIVVLMLAIYRAIEKITWPYYVIAGGVLGLAVLVRSTPMLFPFFLLVYLLIFSSAKISKLRICENTAIMVLAMMVVISPWIVRNYALTERFVPTASVFGISAHAGQYICTHFSENKPWALLDGDAARERSQLALEQGYHFKDGYYQGFYSPNDELKFSAYLAKRVFSEYEKHPLLCARCVTFNLFNFWFAGKSWRSTSMNVLVQLPYMILAAIGIAVCVKNKSFFTIGPMVLFIGYVVAVYIPILAQARYSVPLIPFLSILAAIALVYFREKSVSFVTGAPTLAARENQDAAESATLLVCALENE